MTRRSSLLLFLSSAVFAAFAILAWLGGSSWQVVLFSSQALVGLLWANSGWWPSSARGHWGLGLLLVLPFFLTAGWVVGQTVVERADRLTALERKASQAKERFLDFRKWQEDGLIRIASNEASPIAWRVECDRISKAPLGELVEQLQDLKNRVSAQNGETADAFSVAIDVYLSRLPVERSIYFGRVRDLRNRLSKPLDGAVGFAMGVREPALE